MKPSIANSATRLLLSISLACLTLYAPTCPRAAATSRPPTELLRGFRAKPNPSAASFQPLLRDDTGNLSFGFLRSNDSLLSLAVVHVPSSEPLWVAPNPTQKEVRFSDKAELVFNGTLVVTDRGSRAEWSISGSKSGERLVLLNTSDLQIRSDVTVLWRSFDSPGNTLVQGQNFTDAMELVSSNGQYSMRLGSDFWGLYGAFREGHEQMYLKHTALQARAVISEGNGSLYARVEPDGYFAIYQTGTKPEVDLLPFSSYQRHVDGLLIVRLEPDGNLRAYYWDGSLSKWVLNFEAITELCELPSPCGPYGLCKPGSGCSCADNRTEYAAGCAKGKVTSGDFCGVGRNDFSALRRTGVELPFEELMGYEEAASLAECEGKCAKNCSCWGAVYNNNSGFCYVVAYPIQTLVAAADPNKAGYFKVRESKGRNASGVVMRVGICFAVGVVMVFSGFVAVVVYKAWKRKKRLSEEESGPISPGPYKDLGSASFRSIEMSNR